MRDYYSDEIRNIVFLGHSGVGKTSLVDSILKFNGIIDRMGEVSKGNTFSDFDEEEIKRESSVFTSIIPVEWKDKKINILDTPGYLDYVGEMEAAVNVADNALVVVSATEGVEAGTINACRLTSKHQLPTLFFINKLDHQDADFDNVYNQLRDIYGKSIMLFEVPIIEERKVIGSVNILRNKAWYYDSPDEPQEVPSSMKEVVDQYYSHIAEAVALTDDDLMEKFFEGERFSEEELAQGLMMGVRNGEIKPVYCGSATQMTGIERLLDLISEFLPTYGENEVICAKDNNDNDIKLKTNEEEHFSARVFKTIIDPFVGKISYIKVTSGVLNSDSTVYNAHKDVSERVPQIFIINGKYQEAVGKLFTGDLGAVVKLNSAQTNDTLSSKEYPIKLPRLDFTKAMLGVAIAPKSKDDEDKLSSATQKILEEFPTAHMEYNKDTKETILYGVGDQMIDVMISKMKEKYNVEVIRKQPAIPYKETIRKKVVAEGKHRKQSGGAGQYGHVFIEFEPFDTDSMVFEETVFGGSVPRQYFSSVEEGLREAMQEGVLLGYPVVGVKATLTDGSHHAVDSKDIAFKAAAKLAYKEGMPQADPALLEPIVALKVTVDESYTGTIIGDLNKRRGIINGMDLNEFNEQVIDVEIPQAEVINYATELRSMTQGTGVYTQEFLRYDFALESIVKDLKDSKKS